MARRTRKANGQFKKRKRAKRGHRARGRHGRR